MEKIELGALDESRPFLDDPEHSPLHDNQHLQYLVSKTRNCSFKRWIFVGLSHTIVFLLALVLTSSLPSWNRVFHIHHAVTPFSERPQLWSK